jgi:hypothetical protein
VRVSRGASPELISCVLVSVAIAVGCDDDDSQKPATSTVPLTASAPGLRRQCENAAASLGFAVPCPTKVPLLAGKPADCSGSCVAMAGGGETLDMIFFLNVEGYDSGEASETVRHLIVEGRRVERAPPSPCYGGVPDRTFTVNGGEVTLLECPPATPEAEARIMHGEGAHTEHLLVYWDEGGVRNVVSVHGSTKPNRSLLRRVVSSIEIIDQ